MYLLSSGKSSVLSDFGDLETKSIYQHPNGETTDFQFYQKKRIFVSVNQKGLEILRIKEKKDAQRFEIQRVRKLNIENVYCVACARQSLEEMAFGLSNGQVRLYNYKNTELVHRFNADSNRNSVLFLDYSASDEHMAGVFENGLINIYGIKTKTKMEVINIDGESTLARFHPSKRFQLSIASFKGCVTVYDVQSKRKLFNSADAHTAPCRDLCMSAATPETLISVGYDCLINIFDIRRKTQPLKLNYCHPLSAVALSECGMYFCVGNLKGELITYDMRNTKAHLTLKKVHDCPVTRVAFMPSQVDECGNVSSFCSTVGNQTVERVLSGGAPDLRKSIVANMLGATEGLASNVTRARDSFCDFLDFQATKGIEKMTSRFGTRRDSFDWEGLTRKPSNECNRGSMAQIGIIPGSLGSANNTMSSTCGADSFDGKLNSSDFVNTNARGKRVATEGQSSPKVAPLRDRNNTHKLSGNLMQIAEEQLQFQQEHYDSTSSDKENPNIELELGSRLHILPDACNSTPNPPRSSMTGFMAAAKANSTANTAGSATATAGETPNSDELSRQIGELRVEMNQRFRELEGELKFNAETNKWHIFTQASNLWNQQLDSTEIIRDALGVLLQTDPFVSEFLRLKAENESLKRQLQQLKK